MDDLFGLLILGAMLLGIGLTTRGCWADRLTAESIDKCIELTKEVDKCAAIGQEKK